MKIFKSLSEIKNIPSSVVTTGTFDGLHMGHKKIIDTLIFEAKNNNLTSVILTFWPHPRQVLKQNDEIKLLLTMDEKIELLSTMGIDYLIVIPFSEDFFSLSPTEYISKILISHLNAKTLVIGYDHRFGKDRKGNLAFLHETSDEFQLKIVEIPKQIIDELAISSTKIRNSLQNHNIETANKLLGRAYSFSGKVSLGNQLGRTIDFPTANIELNNESKIVPSHGVYLVKLIFNNLSYFGMMNIGIRPTINGKEEKIEVHIFNFNQDIYNQKIEVIPLCFLRNEQKFDNIESLKSKLNEDKEASLKILHSEFFEA